MDKPHATQLQEAADSGALKLSRMRTEAETLAKLVTGQVGRTQAQIRAIEAASAIGGCTVDEFKKLTQFIYDFARAKDN